MAPTAVLPEIMVQIEHDATCFFRSRHVCEKKADRNHPTRNGGKSAPHESATQGCHGIEPTIAVTISLTTCRRGWLIPNKRFYRVARNDRSDRESTPSWNLTQASEKKCATLCPLPLGEGYTSSAQPDDTARDRAPHNNDTPAAEFMPPLPPPPDQTSGRLTCRVLLCRSGRTNAAT